MSFFQANMQTGILVLLIILVAILCIALFFTNKEVRNIKAGFVKNKHDIIALQSLLNEVGLSAVGGSPDDFDEPVSRFPPMGMIPPEFKDGVQHGAPDSVLNGVPDGGLNGVPDGGLNGVLPTSSGRLTPVEEVDDSENSPTPVSATTAADPAQLNLEKPADSSAEVIPAEDVEQVKSDDESSDDSDESDESSDDSDE